MVAKIAGCALRWRVQKKFQWENNKQQTGLFIFTPMDSALNCKGWNIQNYTCLRRVNTRASGAIYQRYRVNSFELDLLCAISSHCLATGREFVSAYKFIDKQTGNSKRKAKMRGYMYGLIRSKLVGSYEYIGKPDSLVLAVSDLGRKCLDDYWTELNSLLSRMPDRYAQSELHANASVPKIRPKLVA